jgi:hypothetical protein
MLQKLGAPSRPFCQHLVFSVMFKLMVHSNQQSFFRANPLDSIKTLQRQINISMALKRKKMMRFTETSPQTWLKMMPDLRL